MSESSIEQILQIALADHENGRFADAQRGYARVLEQSPDHPDALHLLGLLHSDTDRLQSGVGLIRRAIAANAAAGAFHASLGQLLAAGGDLAGAIAAWRRAIELGAESAETHANLASTLRSGGELESAAAHWFRAGELADNWAEAHFRRGELLMYLGRVAEAESALRRAQTLEPNRPDINTALGCCLAMTQRSAAAVPYFEAVLRQTPPTAPLLVNLAQALWNADRAGAAEPIFRRAAQLDENFAPAQHGLCITFRSLGKIAEALEAANRAVALAPDWADAYHGLGNILHEIGRVDDAITAYGRAIQLKPSHRDAHSSLLLVLQYVYGDDPARMFDEHRRWAGEHEKAELDRAAIATAQSSLQRPVAAGAPSEIHPAPSASQSEIQITGRKLRIAYVSPDLRNHAVAHFFEPLLEGHDRSKFHITCYASVIREDDVSRRLAAKADVWKNVAELDDPQLARQIRADSIDILIDLAGHTAYSRVLAMAHRPARIQMSYLGYPNTTGMQSVDFVITDHVQDPPGTEAFHTERLIRLPRSMHCYRPRSDCPPVAPPAADGPIRFGTFNRLEKYSPLAVEIWAGALVATPGSTLMLKSPALAESFVRDELIARFEKHGVARDRLILVARDPSQIDHLNRYGQLDIALDTFPYNGTTTTCEALWMGVPIVTLAGRTRVARTTAGILDAIGLADLIADTPKSFIKIAAALARDRTRIAELRTTMRDRMKSSPLMNGESLARAIEAAYVRTLTEDE